MFKEGLQCAHRYQKKSGKGLSPRNERKEGTAVPVPQLERGRTSGRRRCQGREQRREVSVCAHQKSAGKTEIREKEGGNTFLPFAQEKGESASR